MTSEDQNNELVIRANFNQAWPSTGVIFRLADHEVYKYRGIIKRIGRTRSAMNFWQIDKRPFVFLTYF